jgi:hypothetical protein
MNECDGWADMGMTNDAERGPNDMQRVLWYVAFFLYLTKFLFFLGTTTNDI